VKQYDEIVDLIISKAEQMSMIQYGRMPDGECGETDFVECDGKLLVQFESYSCGESNSDSYYLPLEFLFDVDYPAKYIVIWEEEKRKKEEERIQREKSKTVYHVVEKTEEYDRREYKRLKAKYEGIIIGKQMPMITTMT
jgi:hypothetical protein